MTGQVIWFLRFARTLQVAAPGYQHRCGGAELPSHMGFRYPEAVAYRQVVTIGGDGAQRIRGIQVPPNPRVQRQETGQVLPGECHGGGQSYQAFHAASRVTYRGKPREMCA